MVDVRRWLWHPWVRRFIGWVFEAMSFAIPVHRLRETETLIAFHHPKPSYAFHILIVPKQSVESLIQLDSTDSAFLTDLFSVVQSLVEEYHLAEGGYRLIVNGGANQDFPQLHFHLVSNVGVQRILKES